MSVGNGGGVPATQIGSVSTEADGSIRGYVPPTRVTVPRARGVRLACAATTTASLFATGGVAGIWRRAANVNATPGGSRSVSGVPSPSWSWRAAPDAMSTRLTAHPSGPGMYVRSITSGTVCFWTTVSGNCRVSPRFPSCCWSWRSTTRGTVGIRSNRQPAADELASSYPAWPPRPSGTRAIDPPIAWEVLQPAMSRSAPEAS